MKTLSIILLRAKDLDRLLDCFRPHQHFWRNIISFLREFALGAVDGVSMEWACYSLTLMCLKIVDLASGLLGDNAEAHVGGMSAVDELMSEAK
jgi:hypothetical protein